MNHKMFKLIHFLKENKAFGATEPLKGLEFGKVKSLSLLMCHNMEMNLLSSTEVISTCLLYPTHGSHPSTCLAFSSSLPSFLPVVSCEFSSVFAG